VGWERPAGHEGRNAAWHMNNHPANARPPAMCRKRKARNRGPSSNVFTGNGAGVVCGVVNRCGYKIGGICMGW